MATEKWLKAIDTNSARALMVSFLLPMNVQGALFMLAGLYFPIRSFLQEKKINWNDILKSIAISASFYLYVLAENCSSYQYRQIIQQIIANRLSFALMPVILALTNNRLRKEILAQSGFFVYAISLMCLLVNVMFVYKFVINAMPGAHITHVDYRIFFERETGIHPTYISMFLCFSLAILICPQESGAAIPRKLILPLIGLILVMMLALFAKSVIIAFFVIAIFYVFFNFKALARHWVGFTAMVLGIITASLLIPFVRQRLNELLVINHGNNNEDVVNNSIIARKMIWNMDTSLLKQCWLKGIGPGRMQYELNTRYFFYEIQNNIPVQFFDPHSEYMQQWLSFGLVGIGLLVMILLIHIMTAFRQKSMLYFYFMIIIVIMFFTESVLSRQHGVLFYALFTSLFFLKKDETAPLNLVFPQEKSTNFV